VKSKVRFARDYKRAEAAEAAKGDFLFLPLGLLGPFGRSPFKNFSLFSLYKEHHEHREHREHR
jgi:hypothetical protein